MDDISHEEVTHISDAKLCSSERLYDASHLSRPVSHLLITKFARRHSLSSVAVQDLLTLVRLHCPSPNQCYWTLYEFNKETEDIHKIITYHYYCGSCTSEVPSACEGFCANCHASLKDRGSVSSFLELSMEEQLNK